MTKIVKRTSMPDYELKGILIQGKRHVYIGTSSYPTSHYRGMDLPSGVTEAGYGVGKTGSGWLAGKYHHENGKVIIDRQPMYPIQWSARKRYEYFTSHYESYAKQADKWRKEHGVKEEIVDVPDAVKKVMGLLQGAHDVVYDGEVKELTRPVRVPSKANALSSVSAQSAAGVARIRGYAKHWIAAVIGVILVIAVIIGRKI